MDLKKEIKKYTKEKKKIKKKDDEIKEKTRKLALLKTELENEAEKTKENKRVYEKINETREEYNKMNIKEAKTYLNLLLSLTKIRKDKRKRIFKELYFAYSLKPFLSVNRESVLEQARKEDKTITKKLERIKRDIPFLINFKGKAISPSYAYRDILKNKEELVMNLYPKKTQQDSEAIVITKKDAKGEEMFRNYSVPLTIYINSNNKEMFKEIELLKEKIKRRTNELEKINKEILKKKGEIILLNKMESD